MNCLEVITIVTTSAKSIASLSLLSINHRVNRVVDLYLVVSVINHRVSRAVDLYLVVSCEFLLSLLPINHRVSRVLELYWVVPVIFMCVYWSTGCLNFTGLFSVTLYVCLLVNTMLELYRVVSCQFLCVFISQQGVCEVENLYSKISFDFD